jgi:hypothetical protein
MKLPHRSFALLLCGLFLATVAVGCGGGKNAQPTATTQAAAAGDKAASTPASKSKTIAPEATSTKAAASKSATPAPRGLGLDSFHYTVELAFRVESEPASDGITGTVTGDFAGPDSHAFSQDYQVAGMNAVEEAVIIGEDGWYRETGKEWRATTADDPDIVNARDLTSADPDFFGDSEFSAKIAVFANEKDSIEGRAVRRYHFTKDQIDALGEVLGSDFFSGTDLAGIETFDFTVWIDEKTGTMLRGKMDISGPADKLFNDGSPVDAPAGSTLRITMDINVSRINDASIKIEPPI